MALNVNIRRLRRDRGMSAAALAEAIGVATSQVSRYERGDISIASTRLEAIAQALGVDLAALLADDPEREAPRPRIEPNGIPVPMEGASLARMRDDLPVFGTALGASRVVEGEAIEQIMLNTGDIVHYAKRPVILDGRADAYGLYVVGSSMYPRHGDGEMILVETKRPPRVGDDVVVYLRPASAEEDDGLRARVVLVKRLVRRSASTVQLEQFSPATSFVIDASEVVQIHRVIPWAELLA